MYIYSAQDHMCSSLQIYGLPFQICPSEVEMEDDWISAAEMLGVSCEWWLSGSVNSLFIYWYRLLGFLLLLWVQISFYEHQHCLGSTVKCFHASGQVCMCCLPYCTCICMNSFIIFINLFKGISVVKYSNNNNNNE